MILSKPSIPKTGRSRGIVKALRFQTILLNLVFYPLFFAVSAVVIPGLTLLGVMLIPLGSWRKTMARARALIKVYGRVVMALGWPLIRISAERSGGSIPQPCIYICNHRAASDAFLMAMLPGEIIQVVNIWPLKLPVLGFFARLAGYLSIREMPDDLFMQRGADLLAQGVSIAAFPEGTRSGSREMGPFHGALFRLALKTGVPIVPVCLSGNEKTPPKGSGILHPSRIRVRTLAAVLHEEYADMTPFKLKNQIRERMAAELEIMESVNEPLCPQ